MTHPSAGSTQWLPKVSEPPKQGKLIFASRYKSKRLSLPAHHRRITQNFLAVFFGELCTVCGLI